MREPRQGASRAGSLERGLGLQWEVRAEVGVATERRCQSLRVRSGQAPPPGSAALAEHRHLPLGHRLGEGRPGGPGNAPEERPGQSRACVLRPSSQRRKQGGWPHAPAPSLPMAASAITLPSCPPVVLAPGLGGHTESRAQVPRFRVTWEHPWALPPARPQGASPEHQQEAARPPPPRACGPLAQTHSPGQPHTDFPQLPTLPRRGQARPSPGPDKRLHVPPPVSPQIPTPAKAQSGPRSLCAGLPLCPETEALGESPAVPPAG